MEVGGLRHWWFQDECRHGLLVIVDDATSQIYYAPLAEEGSARAVMAALREGIETQVCFACCTAIGELSFS